MSRDAIRARMFASRNIKTKVVTVELDGQPTEVEVSQPTIAQRRKLIEVGCLKNGADGRVQADFIPSLAMKRQAAVFCARDPETHLPLIDEKTDKELLDAQGAGGWVDKLGDVALALMGQSDDPETVAKNSEATPSPSR